AVSLLAAEGHGADACLLRALCELAGEKGPKGDAAARWTRELCGESLTRTQLESAAAAYENLREVCDVNALRGALGKATVLPVRAFAASELAALQDRTGVLVLADACDTLADQGA